MKSLLLPILCLGFCAQILHAAPILNSGTYQIFNHPDGGIRPPNYGLRLDGLDGNANHDYTFDFNHQDSDMKLTYDDAANTIRIFGTAVGGNDTGNSWEAGSEGLFALDFMYSLADETNNHITVWNENPGDGGTVTKLSGAPDVASPFNLAPKQKPGSFAFRIDNGHRGFSGLSGWGWVMHDNIDPYEPYQDWIFTVGPQVAPPVPESSTVALFATASVMLGFVGYRSRSRNKKS